MKYAWLYSLCCLAFLSSCLEHNSYYEVDSQLNVVSTIPQDKIAELDLLPISEIGPLQICFADSLLIITTNNPAALLTIFNVNTNKVAAKICPKGRGPNEYLTLFTLKQFGRNDNGDLLLYTFDPTAMRALNITKSIENQHTVIEQNNNIRIDNQLLLSLGANNYLTKQEVSYNDARDYIFFPPKYVIHRDGKQSDMNIYPDILVNEKYRVLPLYIYSGIFRIAPSQKKAADIMATMDYMNIIDIEQQNTLGVIEQGAYFFNDLAAIGQEGTLDVLKYCALDADVTDDYIFVLYDGRTGNEVNRNLKKPQPSIRVYDWAGNFVDGFYLQQAITQIAYDRNRGMLYMLDNEENIYKYKWSI